GSTTRFNVRMRPHVYGEEYASLPDVSLFREAERRSTFISCWNLSDEESAALWGLYVPPSGGVAIRSSYRRLTECFGPLDPQPTDGDGVQLIYIGRVAYMNYETTWMPEGNAFWPYLHKRHSFSFENEIRALMHV